MLRRFVHLDALDENRFAGGEHGVARRCRLDPTTASLWQKRVTAKKYAVANAGAYETEQKKSCRLPPSADRSQPAFAQSAANLYLLTEWRGHRHAIIYLTAGGPSGNEEQLEKFLLLAVEKVVAAHGVYLGANPADEEALQSFCTKRQMGFGDFHSVTTAGELQNALEDCIDALLPRPWK